MRNRRLGFSLLEVTFAVAIFASCIVGVVALFSPTSRAIADLTESTRAARLVDLTRSELERYRDTFAPTPAHSALDLMAVAVGETGLRLVADRDLQRVRPEDLAEEAGGLAPRDRYFWVAVTHHRGSLAPQVGAGFLALTIVVHWPYQPASGGATGYLPVASRQTFTFNLALVP
jgi:type II secretory pathway pseudopilin PulG